MKIMITAALLSLGAVNAAAAAGAGTGSLAHLKSACHTGDFTACSAYNAAIIAQNSGQTGYLAQGFDPFAIVPATHAERTPTAPAAAAGSDSAGKSGVTAAIVQVNR